jgi:hypothetical protein
MDILGYIVGYILGYILDILVFIGIYWDISDMAVTNIEKWKDPPIFKNGKPL